MVADSTSIASARPLGIGFVLHDCSGSPRPSGPVPLGEIGFVLHNWRSTPARTSEIGFVLRISSLGGPSGPWAGRAPGRRPGAGPSPIRNPQSEIRNRGIGFVLHVSASSTFVQTPAAGPPAVGAAKPGIPSGYSDSTDSDVPDSSEPSHGELAAALSRPRRCRFSNWAMVR